jgi:hypothetical protein
LIIPYVKALKFCSSLWQNFIVPNIKETKEVSPWFSISRIIFEKFYIQTQKVNPDPKLEAKSNIPKESQKKEQWLVNLTFSCVKCDATYKTRDELIAHYDKTRHDRYSEWT